MSVGLLFWVLYIVSLVFGGWVNYPFDRRSPSFFIVMILLACLGYEVFGPAIHR